MNLIRKSPCCRQVIVLWYVNLAVAGHKKPSQIALRGLLCVVRRLNCLLLHSHEVYHKVAHHTYTEYKAT